MSRTTCQREYQASGPMALRLSSFARCLCESKPSKKQSPGEIAASGILLTQRLVEGTVKPWRNQEDRPVVWSSPLRMESQGGQIFETAMKPKFNMTWRKSQSQANHQQSLVPPGVHRSFHTQPLAGRSPWKEQPWWAWQYASGHSSQGPWLPLLGIRDLLDSLSRSLPHSVRKIIWRQKLSKLSIQKSQDQWAVLSSCLCNLCAMIYFNIRPWKTAGNCVTSTSKE